MRLNTKLSVAIPTYKRPHLLDKCLSALIEQCHSNSVGIYIYDDSCVDINDSIYDKFQNQFDGLFVHRNMENIGIDKNINKCVSLAETEYVWILGEDDIANNFAIDKILCVINTFKPDYIFTNYQYISNDYKTKLKIAVDINEDHKYKTSVFFQNYGWSVGFLGANIIRKTNWDNNENRFLGTYFNHVGKIFSKLKIDGNVYAISSPLVYNRAESLESFSWINECFEVTSGFSEMAHILERHFPEWGIYCAALINEFNKRINLNSYKTLLVLRSKGVYNIEKYHKFISQKTKLKYLISIFPKALLSPLYSFYKNLKA